MKGKICHAPYRRSGQEFLLEHFQAQLCCPKMAFLLFPRVTKSVQTPGLAFHTKCRCAAETQHLSWLPQVPPTDLMNLVSQGKRRKQSRSSLDPSSCCLHVQGRSRVAKGQRESGGILRSHAGRRRCLTGTKAVRA